MIVGPDQHGGLQAFFMRLDLVQQSDDLREKTINAFLFAADEGEPAVALLGNFVVLGGYVFLEFDGFSPIFVAGKGEDLAYQFKDFRSGAVAFEEWVSFYCPGVIFEEASEDLGRTAAPAVDGLLQVADDEEASSLRISLFRLRVSHTFPDIFLFKSK